VKFPTVDFITPTLNEEQNLSSCLKSIRKQDYPKSKIKIFVIDGGSTDNTKKIAKKYGAIIINNPRVESDSAKYLALKRSKAEYLAFVDADNFIKNKDWLKKMITVLEENKQLFGMESNYFSKKKWGMVNDYLMTIHIADPVARLLSSSLKVSKKNNFIELEVPENGFYPVGADGFVWRKKYFDKVGFIGDRFAEANFGHRSFKLGYRKFGMIKGIGIYHKYCTSLSDFVRKRKKVANKNLRRMSSGHRTWVVSKDKIHLVLVALYCITFVGPFIESLVGVIKEGKKSWVLHPVFCFIAIIIYAYYFSLYKFISITKTNTIFD